jgi:hypothetical protein
MHYPSWRYHRTQKAQIAQDPAHDDALALDGYRDTPAAFLDLSNDPGDDETLNATDATETWQPPAGMDEAREEAAEETPAAAPARAKRKR